MTHDYDHLFPAYREQAQLSGETRIDWLRRDRWLSLPQAEAALDRLEAADLSSARPDALPSFWLHRHGQKRDPELVRRTPCHHLRQARWHDDNAGGGCADATTADRGRVLHRTDAGDELRRFRGACLCACYAPSARRTLAEFGTKVLFSTRSTRCWPGPRVSSGYFSIPSGS